MIVKTNKFVIVFLISCFSLCSIGWSEPFIVLTFNNERQFSEGDGNNEFSLDPNHSTDYIVKQGDSLNSILNAFYSGSGLDRRFIQLSIVIANPHAFAKNNPNFLYSEKKIYLPGKSDIEKLLSGKKLTKKSSDENHSRSGNKIYFFGG